MDNCLDYQDQLTFGEEFVQDIISKKYLLAGEKNWDDIVNRIESELSQYIQDPHNLARITNMIRDRRYIPGGSILFGLGNREVRCSLSNCYFTPIEEDSIEGIFECQKKIARVYSLRGGTGVDITILRPKKESVNNAAIESTGSVSFMPLFSQVTKTIGQSGRRGALIITLDCRHPDLLDFIWCKSRPEQVFPFDPFEKDYPSVTGANISVKLSDELIDAAKNDKNWTFIFPDHKFEKYNEEWDGDYDKWISKGYPIKNYQTIKAKDVLKQIAESAWMSGDPGITYWGNVINWTPGSVDENLKPSGLNPCAEQPLGKYNNCLLSALVLHKYVTNPYFPNAEFNTIAFMEDVRNGILFLDTLIDINIPKHPLKEQRDTDAYGRRVGQEFTGLADMWAMLGYKYGSKEALSFLDNLLQTKALIEIETSLDLAKSKGPAPCFENKPNRKKFITHPYIKRILDNCLKIKRQRLINEILEFGLRNSAFNTVGPTGTISMIADNCSSGIEPIYGIEYYRKTRFNPNSEARLFHLPILKFVGPDIMRMSKDEIKLRYNYLEAHEIDYRTRIAVQQVVQRWTDSSISSTVNLPNNCTIEDIYNIYIEGHAAGLKGLTVFRDKCKAGVLSLTSDGIEDREDIITSDMVRTHLENVKTRIQGTLRSYRYIEHWKKVKVYITVTVDNNEKPIEIFANVPYECGNDDKGNYNPVMFLERTSYWTTFCRLISKDLQLNVPIDILCDQLRKSSTSLGDLSSIILRVLKRFINTDETVTCQIKESKTGGDFCSECKENGIIYENGCEKCILCGYTRCG